jgi:hypothetical protein
MNAALPSCGRKFFSQGRWLKVSPRDVQAELRRAFAQWGRPDIIRVDNGGPWGSDGDFPTDLALWLLGLDIDMHWNDPRSPTQNGVVERSQGTGKRWAEPERCATVAELQRRLRTMDNIQRAAYPSIAGQSRMAAFPTLRHSGRRYNRSWERRHWNHRRVLDHLAGYAVLRRVDKNGDVSIYHRPHYVGCMHRGKPVYVMVDPVRVQWVFSDAEGRQLRVQPAEELQTQRIRTLKVAKRR